MRGKLRVLALLMALLAPSGGVAQNASDYAPFYFFSDQPNALLLNGLIDFRAPLALKRALKDHPTVDVIVLHSNGGSVQASLLIAEEIFDRRLKTVIAAGSTCASSCSFIFFAGRDRIAEGKLGVHQISGATDIETAQLNLSDVIEILSKYGVDPAVITKMLRTPPDQIYYFTPQEVSSLQINRLGQEGSAEESVSHLGTPKFAEQLFGGGNSDDQEIALVPVPLEKPTQYNTMQVKSQEFVVDYLVSAQGTPNQIAENASLHYAEEVLVNGLIFSREKLIERLMSHAREWPRRELRVDMPSVITSCQNESCTVSGRYFYVQGNGTSPDAKSVVRFSFSVNTPRLKIYAHSENPQ